MWRGSLTVGEVTIPATLAPTADERAVRFNQLHEEDLGRIRVRRVCSLDGAEIPPERIVKGFELEPDRYVVITEDDLDRVPVGSGREVRVLRFVPAEALDPVFFKRAYDIVPEADGVRAAAVLRQVLAESGRVGIGKVSFRDREHLAAIRASGRGLLLQTMYWPEEIRPSASVGSESAIGGEELELARALVERLLGPWAPDDFRDEYRDALMRVVEAKASGRTLDELPEGPAPTSDLMAALRASVAAARDLTPGPRRGAGRASTAEGEVASG